MPAPSPKHRICADPRRTLFGGGHLFGGGWSIAVIWVAIVLHLYGQRQDAIDNARRTVADLAGAYEEAADRGVSEIEQTLLHPLPQAVVDALVDAQFGVRPPFGHLPDERDSDWLIQ